MNTNKIISYGTVKRFYKNWFLVAPHIAILDNQKLLQCLDEMSKIKIHIMDMKNQIESSKIHSYFCVLHGQVLYLIEKIKYLIRARRDWENSENTYSDENTYHARRQRFLSVDAITGDDYPMIYIR